MVFVRDNDSKLIVPADQWEWAVDEAVTSLGMTSIETKCFLPPLPIYIPTTTLYSRNYTRFGRRDSCMHEAIRKGAELTVDMVVVSTPPPRSALDKVTDPPSQDQIKQILKFIGTFLGISPYGSEKGFGRFTLMSLETKIPNLSC